MNTLILFKSGECDYCRMAEKFLDQLVQENPRYRDIVIQIVDEDENLALSSQYDYTFVPAFFMNGKLVGEGMLSREKIQEILDTALA